MTREERFNNIVNQLMEFDEIFLDFARMGKCVFTEAIPTACISYNKDGEEMGFFWNPNFFDQCSDYKNMFILCHEMMHIFLKHGKRGRKLTNHDKANITMDISINHLLVDGYGFSRSSIENWQKYCWRDTVFNIPVKAQPSFEGYYRIDDKYFKKDISLIDLHKFYKPESEKGEDHVPVPDEIPLPPELEKKIADSLLRIPGGSDEERDFLESVVAINIKRKPKFEIVVRNATKSIVKKTKVFSESWIKPDRRLHDVCPDIPVNLRIDDKPRKDKYLCHFYIDNSWSCADYIQRFADCANSLNPEVFDAQVFSFDTRVHPIEKINGKYHVKGGGGTVFGVVVSHAEKAERQPDVIFVLTDGYAELVTTKQPKKWHWLITENGSPSLIKKAGHWWPLSQFE